MPYITVRYLLVAIGANGYKYEYWFRTLADFIRWLLDFDEEELSSYVLYDEDKVILKWSDEEGLTS